MFPGLGSALKDQGLMVQHLIDGGVAAMAHQGFGGPDGARRHAGDLPGHSLDYKTTAFQKQSFLLGCFHVIRIYMKSIKHFRRYTS